MLQGRGRGEDGEANDIEHEERDALEIDDEDFAGEGGDHEEDRPDKKYLNGDDRKKWLEVVPEMIRLDARVIGPRGKCSKEGAEHHAGEGEEGSHVGAGPAPAEIAEFGDRLGEQNLVGVALEVAEDGSAEDGSDDDDAEQRGSDIVVGIRVGRIQKNLAIAVADGAEVFRGHAEERKREPEQEVDVGREALEAEPEFEGEELPKQRHDKSSTRERLIRKLTFCLLR